MFKILVTDDEQIVIDSLSFIINKNFADEAKVFTALSGTEAIETVIEATGGTKEQLLYETSDLIYHLIVLLTEKGLRIEDLARELKARHKE